MESAIATACSGCHALCSFFYGVGARSKKGTQIPHSASDIAGVCIFARESHQGFGAGGDGTKTTSTWCRSGAAGSPVSSIR